MNEELTNKDIDAILEGVKKSLQEDREGRLTIRRAKDDRDVYMDVAGNRYNISVTFKAEV